MDSTGKLTRRIRKEGRILHTGEAESGRRYVCGKKRVPQAEEDPENDEKPAIEWSRCVSEQLNCFIKQVNVLVEMKVAFEEKIIGQIDG